MCVKEANLPSNHRERAKAVDIRQVHKIYANGTHALKGIELSIYDDDFLVIIGPSGAGKSTLLRCINRLIRPTSGTMFFMGENLMELDGYRLRNIRRRIGMIFQQFNLVRRLTIIENVLMGRLPHCSNMGRHGLSLARIFSRRDREIAFACLHKVHIAELAFQRADNISGGQQQRVAIARMLAQEPKLILADEPVASLDPASAEIVMQTLLEIHESHQIPVIVNLHQIELGCRYGKRIIGMKDGMIVFDGNRAELDHDILTRIYGKELDVGLGRISCRDPYKLGRQAEQEYSLPAQEMWLHNRYPSVTTLAGP